MTLTGGCLCGALRYEISGEIPMRFYCLCRTCQKVSGGAGNFSIGIEGKYFRYTKGTPRKYAHADGAPCREFCGDCGVHIAARSPKLPDGLVVKVGSLDDPSVFGGPGMAVWASEKYKFHVIQEGVPTFDTIPGR